jgi:DNA-dependent RNA polymerase
VREALPVVVGLLDRWCATVKGRPRGGVALVQAIGTDRAAHVGLAHCLNECLQAPTVTRLAATIGADMDDERRLDLLGPLYRRRAERSRHVVLQRRLARVEPLTSVERTESGLLVLSAILDATDLVERRRMPGRRSPRVVPSDGFRRWLREAEAAEDERAVWPLPTPTPAVWNGPKDGPCGPFVAAVTRGHRSAFEAIRPVLNGLGSVPVLADRETLEFVRSSWFNGVDLPGLPSRFTPDIDGRTWDGRGLWREWHARDGQRLDARSLLLTAAEVEGTFYLPHRADFRGRVYCMPRGLNPQGSDLSRGLLRFEDRPLADPGWLDAQGGRAWGLDKQPFERRREWCLANMDTILQAGLHPAEAPEFWTRAEQPWRFLAYCRERRRWADTGRCGLPCEHDLTSSAYQLVALVLRDDRLAAATNLVDSPEPVDFYAGLVAEFMQDPPADWKVWLQARRPSLRGLFKHWAVAGGYGSLPTNLARWTRWWVDVQPGAPPSGSSTTDLSDAIQAVMGRHGTPLLDWLRAVGREKTELAWTTKSGFPARSSYRRCYNRRVRTRAGGTTRYASLRFEGNRPDRRKQSAALPAHFVHALDASVVHRTVRSWTGPLFTVHDCFSTTPDLVPDLRDRARRFLSDVGPDDLASFAAAAGIDRDLPEIGPFDPRAVLDSTYCLH